MTARIPGVLIAICLSTRFLSAAQEPAALAVKARDVLQKHCYRCHGQDGSLEGGLSYILDRDRLVARKKVVPGDARQSPLYKKIISGKMPPPDVKDRPTQAEMDLLAKWIDEGANAAVVKVDRAPMAETTVLTMIRDDLETVEKRSRRFTRYFSLAHLANQGLNKEELDTYRKALAKLLNSLSWHPRITIPKAIDPEGLVLRIDLRHFMWDANLWNRLVAEYPYAVIHDTASARASVVGTATRVPVLRADWFIASASRPPLYYDLLQIPTSATELERQLRVDVTQNILQERIARAGFNGSGISRNNRVLERHDSVHGAYWRTYDFDAIPQNLIERDILLPDRRNLFAYPLGPGGTENSFQHAGGEIIFNLPNGLHGFMLINAENTRIDKGPIAIVSDPKRPDRAVEPGVSCMSCHYSGILQKNDQIRDHVEKNRKAFSAKDADLVRAHYPPTTKMKELMDEDAERYRVALEKTGNKVAKLEPVSTLTLRYEADVDVETAAAEVGLRPRDFLARVLSQEAVARNLGGLRVSGGIVSRQALVQAFGDVARGMRLGSVLQAGATGQILPDNTGEVDPLEGSTSQTNAVTFSRDGRRALLASADRSVRVWDVEAGRETRRLVGHSASVWSVAFNHEGKQAASGGADAVVRVWDLDTGNDLYRLEGHGGLVAAVAFSPDGKRLLSAALDHTIILWDLETGKAIRRLEGARHVNCLTFSPDGDKALVAAGNVLQLYEIESGKLTRTFEGHTDSVTSACFTSDGKQILSGSDDGSVRLWDLSGRSVRSFMGHESYVKSVSFSPDGKQVLSAGTDATVRLWDMATGNELKKFGKHTNSVLGASFTPDGTATLSGSNDAEVRVWRLAKARVDSTPSVNPEVKIEPEKPRELKPSKFLPLKGTISNLMLSPNGRWIFYLAPQGDRLERIDTNTMQRTPGLSLLPSTQTVTLSTDGKVLYTLSPGEKAGTTSIQVIDAPRWAVQKTLTIPLVAYDLTADDRGRLYLSGGAGDWTDVSVVDAARGDVLARWGGVWTRSHVHLSANQKRVYVGTQGVTPGSLDAFVIPSRLDDKPTLAKSSARNERTLGGEFIVTPDGRYVVTRTGVVLRAAAESENDLRYDATIRPFLGAAVASEQSSLFVSTAEGTLVRYSYSDFKTKAVYRLPGIGYQVACDTKKGLLYIAVFDPKSLAARPGERAGGELHVYEMSEK